VVSDHLPAARPDGTPGNIQLVPIGRSPEAIAWMVVRSWLEGSKRGRDILVRLATTPAEAAEELRQYLSTETAPAAMSTIVTGGMVERLVNIAQAGVVNIAASNPVVPPRQLPPDVADFTDRALEIGQIVGRVSARDEGPGTPLVCAIVGGGGVGKTALAVRLAYRFAETYGDAQLYVNLRGAEARPADPHQVLEGLIRALGVEPERIPADTDERSGLYRAALSSRRSVILLDNAADARQLRPLLPGEGDSVVLVTSRDPLVGLAAAMRVDLDVLTLPDAVALLERIIGPERVAAEPGAAEALARSCGALPLALRIVAARLASKPNWTMSRMVARLEDENRRLSELEAGDLAVRASFMLSYQALNPTQRAAFRLASLAPGPSFPAWLIQPLAQTDADTAEEVIERLADLHLVEYAGEDAIGQPRYRFHDLLKLFARERLAEEDPTDEQRAALERALGGYLAIARRGLYLMSPHSKRDPHQGLATRWTVPQRLMDELMAEPYAWFTGEHACLVAAIQQAHGWQLWPYVHELAEQMHYYFRVRSLLDDWERTHRLALAAARADGDRRAEGWTLRNLGNALQDQGRYGEAVSSFSDAADIFGELDNTLGRAAAVCNLGETRMTQGRFAEAADYLTRCLPDWRAVDDQVGVAYTLDNIGFIRTCQGDFGSAEDYFRRSLAMFRELGDSFGEAHSLRRRADLNAERGLLDAAESDVRLAAEIFSGMSSAPGGAWAAICSARLRLRQGSSEEALDEATSAVQVFHDHGDLRAAATGMVVVGEALLACGRNDEAKASLDQARERLARLGDEFGAAQAGYGVACAQTRTGARAAAVAELNEAATAFARLPAPLWERRARDLLAQLEAEM
jgi:tetratricopeptide (TPR) repeat protein